jgi:formate hydrogenlyase subunit 6/NADH:ubiquinone oxidoreductase subunit I
VVAISLWENKANAEAYNTNTYPEVLKSMSRFIEGTPKLQTSEVLNSTFHKIAEVDAGPCVSCRLCETVCEKDAIFVPNPITQAKRYLPVL